eukprot:105162_1
MGACSLKVQQEQQHQPQRLITSETPEYTCDKVIEIDRALSKYYTNCARYDYFNENKEGKFLLFIDENSFDDVDLENIFLSDSEHNCILTQMDSKFPLPMLYDEENINKSIRNVAIFTVLQYCYKYDQPPSHEWLREKRKEKMILSLSPKLIGKEDADFLQQWLAKNQDAKDRELILDCLYVYGQMTKKKNENINGQNIEDEKK